MEYSLSLAKEAPKYYNKQYLGAVTSSLRQMHPNWKGVVFMVSTSVIVGFWISLCCTLILPILLFLVLAARRKLSVAPAAVGLAAFFVSQVVLRMPILNVLAAVPAWQAFAQNTIPYILVLSISAGLFEESARLAGAALLKRYRSYQDALSFGLGHGLCEVFFLLGFTQINNLLYSYAINSGAFSSMTSALPQETVSQIFQQFTSADPVMIYVAILERVFAVTIHLFCAVLIVEGLRNRHAFRGYALALLSHAAFNFVGVTVGEYLGVWFAEGAMLVLAVAAAIYIVNAKRLFEETAPCGNPA